MILSCPQYAARFQIYAQLLEASVRGSGGEIGQSRLVGCDCYTDIPAARTARFVDDVTVSRCTHVPMASIKYAEFVVNTERLQYRRVAAQRITDFARDAARPSRAHASRSAGKRGPRLPRLTCQ